MAILLVEDGCCCLGGECDYCGTDCTPTSISVSFSPDHDISGYSDCTFAGWCGTDFGGQEDCVDYKYWRNPNIYLNDVVVDRCWDGVGDTCSCYYSHSGGDCLTVQVYDNDQCTGSYDLVDMTQLTMVRIESSSTISVVVAAVKNCGSRTYCGPQRIDLVHFWNGSGYGGCDSINTTVVPRPHSGPNGGTNPWFFCDGDYDDCWSSQMHIYNYCTGSATLVGSC